jgi:hypothetical protein
MRSIADHDVPVADGVAGDEAAPDVGIAGDEFFNDGSIRPLENEKGAVNRIRKGAAEEEFAAIVGFAGEAEMLLAEGGAFFDVVFADLLIEKSEIGHESLPSED